MNEENDKAIKELIVSLMQWRQKWDIKHRKIEVKIKEDIAFVSVTDDYTPQDFELKR